MKIHTHPSVRMMRAGATNRFGLLDMLEQVRGDNLRIAEIGSHIGESARIMSVCPRVAEIVCVDRWLNPLAERLFNLNQGEKMTKVKAASPEAAQLFADRDFDLVYIDASHDYPAVTADILAWRPKTKRYIGGHDYGTSHGGVVRAVNVELGQPLRVFRDRSWLCDLDRTFTHSAHYELVRNYEAVPCEE